MKKLFVLVSLIAALTANSVCAFAENEATEVVTSETEIEVVADGEIAEEEVIGGTDAETEIVVVDGHQPAASNTKLYVEITMAPRVVVADSAAVIELYEEDGTLLGSKEEWVGGITESLKLEFDVPEYSAGQKFILKLKSGLVYIKYYDRTYGVGEEVVLETYGYKNEDGTAGVANSFVIEGGPLYEQAIVMYVEGNQLELYPRAKLIDDVAMVPVMAVAEALGLNARYDEKYNSVVCEIGDDQAIFNMDTAYATILGEDLYLPRKCEFIDETAYVPVRPLAEAFGSSIETFDFGDHIDVCLGASEKVKEYRNKIPVNKWGISSRTNYLVWIDKSDYRVRVYTGSQYKWEEAASFSCAIGAPGSPTPTGSYEYQYRMDGWYYDGYYVGPCLVFYGNYALHSTLLGYNGVPYDNRTGVMISHGCIRLKKPDIDWIAARLPYKSRVYITE